MPGVCSGWSSRPSRREAEACAPPALPKALPRSPPCASYWPESRRGRKGPINFSLIRLDPERQRWTLRANTTERHFLGEMSHLDQRLSSIFQGGPRRNSQAGLRGCLRGMERSSLSSCRNQGAMSRQGVEEVPGLVGGIAGGGSEPSTRLTARAPHPHSGPAYSTCLGPEAGKPSSQRPRSGRSCLRSGWGQDWELAGALPAAVSSPADCVSGQGVDSS